jgi:hypothetical protein
MRVSSLILPAILLTPALAQDGSVTVGNPAWGGLIVRFSAKVEPPGSGSERLSGGVIVTSDGSHRFINDAAHKRQFGYDLHGALLGDGQTLQITLEPLVTGRGSFEVNPGWTLMAPPRFPAMPVMRAGDTAAVDLLVNPGTGQKIVEYLSVERADLDPARVARTPARDFGIDDVELFLDRPRVAINGKLLEASAEFGGGIRAHALWLFIPGEGTFVVTLWPEPGFQKAGMLEGKTMTFRYGTSEYRVEAAGPIAPGSGLFNLYLHFDAKARNRNSQFQIGGADKGAWLIQKE